MIYIKSKANVVLDLNGSFSFLHGLFFFGYIKFLETLKLFANLSVRTQESNSVTIRRGFYAHFTLRTFLVKRYAFVEFKIKEYDFRL